VQPSDVTLAVIDVDHFKSINDRFGHTAGDITLQVISKALQKSVRKSDFIARYGGEEFVLLMPGVSLENATLPLDKVRKVIKNIPFKFREKQIELRNDVKFVQQQSENQKLLWGDPEYKKTQSLAIKESLNNPEIKQKISSQQKEKWKDEETFYHAL
jgi:diguanylate cyclase (GGDEF)-like protein